MNYVGVALLGMNERSQAAMQMFLERQSAHAYRTVDRLKASIAVFDLDGSRGNRDWLEFREQHPDFPVVLVSVRQPDEPDLVWVRKPVQGPALLAALDKLRPPMEPEEPEAAPAGLFSFDPDPSQAPFPGWEPRPEYVPPDSPQPAASPSGPAVTPVAATPVPQVRPLLTARPAPAQGQASQPISQPTSQPAAQPAARPAARPATKRPKNRHYGHVIDISQDRELFFKPELYYMGVVGEALRQALTDGIPRVITGTLQRGQSILVTAENGGSVYCDLSDGVLRYLCLVPLADQNVVMRKGSQQDLEARSGTPAHGETFLWKMSLWSSRGRCPEGTDLDAQVVLTRWPILAHLPPFPHAVRMTALWRSHGVSLNETANTLHIPLAYVLAFYTAALATGTARQNSADPAAGNGSPPAVPDQKARRKAGGRSGLLSQIRSLIKN